MLKIKETFKQEHRWWRISSSLRSSFSAMLVAQRFREALRWMFLGPVIWINSFANFRYISESTLLGPGQHSAHKYEIFGYLAWFAEHGQVGYPRKEH